MKMRGNRLRRVCPERDLLNTKIDGLVKQTKGFREKVLEMEKRKREIEE